MKRYGKQRSSRVAWDEANLNFLEATKTPKRKITEPKTPYHAPDGFVSPFAREDALDDAEHAQAVWNALNDIASSSGETSTSRKQGDWASDDDEDPDESSNFEYGWSQNDHRSEFAERRKAHYNEYWMLKSLQKDLAMNDAEDDDEMQINGEEDMITDGIHLVHLHEESSTSGGSKSNNGKKPQK